MAQDDVTKKMSESSDKPASVKGGGDQSSQNAANLPEEMSKAGGKPSEKGAQPSGVGSGFKDPLPPGTDSASGPGSDGPV